MSDTDSRRPMSEMSALLRRRWTALRTVCCSTGLFYVVIILAGLQFSNGVVDGLKINRINMPGPMKNGTMESVIVDCEYTYTEGDMKGFVLKWFFNQEADPVYQWIPPNAPEAIGILTTKIDLGYRASEDNFTMHRALRILKPTVEVAGNYRCHVSSLNGGFADQAKELVVYVPEDKVSINYTKPTQNTVNLTCLVMGIYPAPEAYILLFRGDEETPEKITNPIVSVKVNGDGSYDTILYREFEDNHLHPKTSFECVFDIATANYNATDRITYYPGLPASTSTPGSTPVHHKENISTEFSLVDVQSINDAGRQTTVAWPSSAIGLVVFMSVIISRFQQHFS